MKKTKENKGKKKRKPQGVPLREEPKNFKAIVLTFTAVYDVFTLLMNLHDFETDPACSVNIFRDAHTDALLTFFCGTEEN